MILKAESLPRIRDRVVDEKLKPVGTVFDIFGPVSSPYVSVKTDMGDLHRLINHVLYFIPSSKSKKVKRRRRK
jgi:rRNA processing protein Gar1